MIRVTLIAVAACISACKLHAAVATVSPRMTVASVDAAIARTFGARAPIFRCIAQRESTYRRDPGAALAAVSPTNDHGLLQIHVFTGERGRAGFSIAQLHTLAGNLAAAWRVSEHGRNLQPWAGGRYPCW